MRSDASLGGGDDSLRRDTSHRRAAFRSRGSGRVLSYLALSLLFFWRNGFEHPASTYIGHGSDVQHYIWFLAWWSHAISIQ